MNRVNLYVLTTLRIDARGNIASHNAGVTFDIFEAEAHRTLAIENDFDTFEVSDDWRDDAEQSSLIGAMRDFREIVQRMQESALR